MSWYVHPSKQLRDDELPPELVVTNRDGSIEQVYVPYNASDQLKVENAKLEELLLDLYILCYPQSFEWEVTDHTYEKYSPCELCKKAHGGKSPCASTSKDLEEECCKPFQAEVVADRMRELGIEANDD